MIDLPKPPDELLNRYQALSEWNTFLGYRGSISHSMWVPKNDPNSIDDIDLIGICIPPPEYYIGLKRFGNHGNGTLTIMEGEWDIVVYELQKMVLMLSQANPNVLSILWLNPDHILYRNYAIKQLWYNRDLFLTKRIATTYYGYAKEQFKKMLSYERNGYMGAKRKALVEVFGFDAKNASHMIRLLRTACEALQTGSLQIERTEDRDELLEIKRGEWSLEQIELESNRLFKLIDELAEKSHLPEAVDMDFMSRLTLDIIFKTWQEREDAL